MIGRVQNLFESLFVLIMNTLREIGDLQRREKLWEVHKEDK